jgi:hypothetical protein
VTGLFLTLDSFRIRNIFERNRREQLNIPELWAKVAGHLMAAIFQLQDPPVQRVN